MVGVGSPPTSHHVSVVPPAAVLQHVPTWFAGGLSAKVHTA